jgi:biotin-dependent carboxylase-like uncharacterized protein
MIEIVDNGPLTTVQDAGRPGLAHIGVPRSGAVDPALAALCNRLVGNEPSAAVVETVGSLTVRALAPVTVASDVEPVAHSLRGGETIRIEVGGRQWHYLAVRGGIDIAPVLGSRSTDTLSGVAGPPLAVGMQLPVGGEPAGLPVGDISPIRPSDPIARVTAGPRLDWFAEDTLGRLRAGEWSIGVASRVGVRLVGDVLDRVRHDELPSEGLVRGAIQVPPDGAPIMMLADHPTTGGYPVVAVVDPDDVAIIAQQLPGAAIRFA